MNSKVTSDVLETHAHAHAHTQAAVGESLVGISTYPFYMTTVDASTILATATWMLDGAGEAPTPVVHEGVSE